MTINSPNEPEKDEKKKTPLPVTHKALIGVGVALLVCGAVLVNSAGTKEPQLMEKAPTTTYTEESTTIESDLFGHSDDPKQEKTKRKKTSKKGNTSIFDVFDLPEVLSPVKQGTPRATVLLALAEENNTTYKKKKVALANKEKEKPVIPPIGTIITPPVLPPIEPEKPIINPPVVESTPTIVASPNEQIIEKYGAFDLNNYYYVTDSQDSSPIISIEGRIDSTVSGPQRVTIRAVNKYGNYATQTLMFNVNARPQLISDKEQPVEIQIDDVDFNLFGLITAVDEEDGDISGAIDIVSTTLNRHEEGPGTVKFKVTDSKGFSAYETLSFLVTNEAPVVVFDPVDTHEINQTFDPLVGVTMTDREDGPIQPTSEMILESTVDSTTEGTYMVTYLVKDSHGKSSGIKKRVVKVVNEAPVIHGASDHTFTIGEPITKETLMAGVSATDREDEKLSLPLIVELNEADFSAIDLSKEGTYPLTYTVTDSMGKETKKTVSIVITNEAPVIHGVRATVDLAVGDDFDHLAGVTATDKETASEKLVIKVTGVPDNGSLDTSVSGVHELTYVAVDEHGKQSEPVISTVTVKESSSEFSSPLLLPGPSSPMGERENPLKEGEMEFHRGRDYAANAGTPILAIGGGTVIVSDTHFSWGEYVVIEHDNGCTSLYAHQSERKVSVGETVKQGDIIGLVGSTGDSTGPHLHVEVVPSGHWNTSDESELVDIDTLLTK